MPKNSGPAKRDMFDSHGAGKGDADRSPGWREHYDEVEWGQKYCGLNQPGFESIGPGRIRKTYGPVVPRPVDFPDWRKPVKLIDCMACVKCGLIKHVNQFATPDVCTACASVEKQESSSEMHDAAFQPITETGLGWQ